MAVSVGVMFLLFLDPNGISTVVICVFFNLEFFGGVFLFLLMSWFISHYGYFNKIYEGVFFNFHITQQCKN